MVDISAVTVFWLDGRPASLVVWGELPRRLGLVSGCKVSVTVADGHISITVVTGTLGSVTVEEYTPEV